MRVALFVFLRFRGRISGLFSDKNSRLVQQRIDGKKKKFRRSRTLKFPKTPQELTFLQEERKAPKFLIVSLLFRTKCRCSIHRKDRREGNNIVIRHLHQCLRTILSTVISVIQLCIDVNDALIQNLFDFLRTVFNFGNQIFAGASRASVKVATLHSASYFFIAHDYFQLREELSNYVILIRFDGRSRCIRITRLKNSLINQRIEPAAQFPTD